MAMDKQHSEEFSRAATRFDTALDLRQMLDSDLQRAVGLFISPFTLCSRISQQDNSSQETNSLFERH